MFTKKQTIILIVLIFVLIGAIFLYWQRYDKWPWQKEVSLATPTVTVSPEGMSSETPPAQTTRGQIMKDLAGQISQLSPVEPVLGGQWFVGRFWYVKGSDEYVYTEYEDGHILRMILVKATAQENDFDYKVEAYFEPGESGWLLKSGQDSQRIKDLDLYELNQNTGEWERKN
ncbi:hypothetical protein KJ866_03945 [Patescibacteria group bacterium]|nr:hypothetical protein [Patescibacteria group bacterium]MBU2220083.1 hypothetical protein [Patescibacteria group bacterium]MBU2264923.1 hypothetical protein [Patescibacteria group bacterium]